MGSELTSWCFKFIGLYFLFFFFRFKKKIIFLSWRIIALQNSVGFCQSIELSFLTMRTNYTLCDGKKKLHSEYTVKCKEGNWDRTADSILHNFCTDLYIYYLYIRHTYGCKTVETDIQTVKFYPYPLANLYFSQHGLYCAFLTQRQVWTFCTRKSLVAQRSF